MEHEDLAVAAVVRFEGEAFSFAVSDDPPLLIALAVRAAIRKECEQGHSQFGGDEKEFGGDGGGVAGDAGGEDAAVGVEVVEEVAGVDAFPGDLVGLQGHGEHKGGQPDGAQEAEGPREAVPGHRHWRLLGLWLRRWQCGRGPFGFGAGGGVVDHETSGESEAIFRGVEKVAAADVACFLAAAVGGPGGARIPAELVGKCGVLLCLEVVDANTDAAF
jgi:hypothetical protein